MLLIGLNGRKHAGKDSAAEVIHSWGEARSLNVNDQGFADRMKWSFARIFFPDICLEDALRWCDQLKETGIVTVTGVDVMAEITGRVSLQNYGTESHREIFGSDFWVDKLLPINAIEATEIWAKPGRWHRPDIAVITDCRFENEARRIKIMGGYVWEIVRPDLDDGDQHDSEIPLPRELVDHTFINNSTLEMFQTDVNSWMTAEFHMKFIPQPDPLADDSPFSAPEISSGYPLDPGEQEVVDHVADQQET
jgi:hypothetical protein